MGQLEGVMELGDYCQQIELYGKPELIQAESPIERFTAGDIELVYDRRIRGTTYAGSAMLGTLYGDTREATYVTNAAWRGRNLATAAMQRLLGEAFSNDGKLQRVTFVVGHHNQASLAVVGKLNAELVSSERQHQKFELSRQRFMETVENQEAGA